VQRRDIGDGLINAAGALWSRRSPVAGVLSAPFYVCPKRQGFERLPLPDDPALVAIRARLAREFPVDVPPPVTVDRIAFLHMVFRREVPLIRDLQNGVT
jgi:hypothetical protein